MKNTNYKAKIALLSAQRLNAAIVHCGGVPISWKPDAIDQVANLLGSGAITFEQIEALPLVSVSTAPAAAAVDAETIKLINDSSVRITASIDRSNQALDEARQLGAKVDRSLSDLNVRVDAKVDEFAKQVAAISKPDPSKVTAEINAAVSRLFGEFKKEVPIAVIEQIATNLGTFETKTAGEVFGEAICQYGLGNDWIDFRSLPVSVWNDPNAPQLVDDYVFTPAHLHQALIALDGSLPDNVWLGGERGTGKTEFVTQIAARLQRRLFRINFDEALERADFIGGNSIKEGSVVWQEGIVTQAIQYAGAIVLLDEIGFARAQSLATLHALCEHSPHRSITIAETGKRIPVASHVVFFCADNSNGHGDHSGNFAGVREQNTAFLDRFSFTLRFEYLNSTDEADLIVKRTGLQPKAAAIIVQFAGVARQKARGGLLTQPPSLRQLFAFARAVKKGLPVRTAFNNAIVNKFPAECEAELVGVFTSQINEDEFKQALK
jgi:nitric oxide reductase NorQ protein